MAADVSEQSKFIMASRCSFCGSAVFKIFSFSLSGFLTYTSKTDEVIINNLPQGIPVKVIATFFALNLLLAYPIDFLVLMKNIEQLQVYEELTKKVSTKICYFLLRTFGVLVILVLAIFIPHLALVNSFAGSLYFCTSFIFPGLFHLVLKYNKLTKLQIAVDFALVLIGVFGFFFGLIATIMSLV